MGVFGDYHSIALLRVLICSHTQQPVFPMSDRGQFEATIDPGSIPFYSPSYISLLAAHSWIRALPLTAEHLQRTAR